MPDVSGFTPTNSLERVLLAVAQGEDERHLLAALYSSNLILPQPHAESEGPSRTWSIGVFEGVCPVYTSLAQFEKAFPARNIMYAEVPGASVVTHWDEQRPMALNLAADLALEMPGVVVKALPEGLPDNVSRAPEGKLRFGQPEGEVPARLVEGVTAFAARHPEVQAAYVGLFAPADHDRGRLLVGLLLADDVSQADVLSAAGTELPEALHGIEASLMAFTRSDPGPAGDYFLSSVEPFWSRS